MIAGLILAGGEGKRLGAVDKAFVELCSKPLIDYALTALGPQTDKIAISANGDAARFASYAYPVLRDEIPDVGPLAGVAAGLAWATRLGAAFLLTLPVDTPQAPDDLRARLEPGPSVACYGGRQHHLVSLWPTNFLPKLINFLETPSAFRVRDALDLCAARRVEFVGAFDPFLNINTPQDLAAVEAFLVRRD